MHLKATGKVQKDAHLKNELQDKDDKSLSPRHSM